MLFYVPTKGLKIQKFVSILNVKMRVHSNNKLMQKSSIPTKDLVFEIKNIYYRNQNVLLFSAVGSCHKSKSFGFLGLSP